MQPLRSSAFFTASVVAHLAVGALLFRTAGPSIVEAPAAATLTGETLSLPDDLVTEGVEPVSANAPATPNPAPNARANARAPKGRTASSFATGIYGAAGDRSANDLSNAFTRAFPQAASADPGWLGVPFGGGGSAFVSLEIDASGAFVSAHIDEHASPVLRRGIERTVALIRGRTFTAHAAVTALYLSATVSPDEVHDGLHGDVFAIGGSFEGHQGNAFFALAAGRRIDLTVRVQGVRALRGGPGK